MIRFCQKRLWLEEEGQDLTEYALLLFLLCLTSVMAMRSFASTITNIYAQASGHVIAARSNTPASATSSSGAISTRPTAVHVDSFHEGNGMDILTDPASLSSQKP